MKKVVNVCVPTFSTGYIRRFIRDIIGTMTDANVSFEEDMDDTSTPRNKRTCPNDSPDPKDRLLSRDVETYGHCKKKCTSTCEALQCDLHVFPAHGFTLIVKVSARNNIRQFPN